ncbi:unnamed protein product [Lactuca virosa]|uniref:Uncharacterized protein n=1 Tax=Lactuca virosa TaxID=75947 RepID=A0AAU9MJY9_9ASTR|nr:unnamed protein product [Lactuca virosa]
MNIHHNNGAREVIQYILLHAHCNTRDAWYIGVGEDEAVQLFYCFVESEGNPEEDPLIVWLAGGPGCATLRSFFFQIGPMQIQYDNYMDNVPALQLHPNSWTKVANVIYLDAPTQPDISYTKTPEAIRSSDTSSAAQTAEFLRKESSKILKNPMYVAGISYSGIVVPIITEELYKGNDEGLEPILNIKGYMAGNPLTDKSLDINSRFEYAYRLALISKDLYESTRKACNGDYANADSNNLQCMSNIYEVNKRVKGIYTQQILEPDCDPATNLLTIIIPIVRGNRRALQANPINDSICQVTIMSMQSLGPMTKRLRKPLIYVREQVTTAPEFKPKECFVMVKRWFAHKPI